MDTEQQKTEILSFISGYKNSFSYRWTKPGNNVSNLDAARGGEWENDEECGKECLRGVR